MFLFSFHFYMYLILLLVQFLYILVIDPVISILFFIYSGFVVIYKITVTACPTCEGNSASVSCEQSWQH